MASADEIANAIMQQEVGAETISEAKAEALDALCYEKNVLPETVAGRYGKKRLEDLTEAEHYRAFQALNKSSGRG